jgi:hypothetical protein
MTQTYTNRVTAKAAQRPEVAARRAKARALPAGYGWMIAALVSIGLWLAVAELILALVRI